MSLLLFYGVSPQYIGAVENEENCLSVEKIITLSKKANVSTDYILLGKTSCIDETLLSSLNNISEEDLNSYINVIKQIIFLVKKHNWILF